MEKIENWNFGGDYGEAEDDEINPTLLTPDDVIVPEIYIMVIALLYCFFSAVRFIVLNLVMLEWL